MKTVLAPHALGKIKRDLIFYVGEKARQAKKEYGKENVLDASIGILLDDQGELALLPAVEEASRRLNPGEIARYAPIAGLKEYREDVLEYLLGDSLNKCPAAALATAGATGALRLAMWNFLEPGDAVITHDHYWTPYGTMARDALRELITFPTFTGDQSFNMEGCLSLTKETLKRQKRCLLVINSPCHNPTGMCLNLDEARRLKEGLSDLCNQYPEYPLTLIMDIAYWEFEEPEFNKSLVALFDELPNNFIFAMAYSLSKSLTRYGLRTGAFVMRTSNRDFLDEVMGTLVMSIRSMWSNTTRMGQAVFSTIYRDKALQRQLAAEQNSFANLCNSRGRIFMDEAARCGLPTTPYARGFFVTIPCENSVEVSERLFGEHIYLVPMKKGVRVAFCALPTHQIPGLAERIAKAL